MGWPQRRTMASLLPPRGTAQSAAPHPARPVPPPRLHHPLKTDHTHRTALCPSQAQPQHRAGSCVAPRVPCPLQSQRATDTPHSMRPDWRQSGPPAPSSNLKKNTVQSISGEGSTKYAVIPLSMRSDAAHILVSSSSEAQTPRFKPSEREKNPLSTWLDLTNAQRTAIVQKHMYG